jgi:proteasome assembly chaperone (PAC2) family protein
MEHVRWTARPDLHNPVVIVAFEGWNDAGDAASNAARFLADRWDAEAFATIDPEDFFDFTSTRPQVSMDEEGIRQIEWPVTTFASTTIPGTSTDVMIVIGTEPQLRWRTFCQQITSVAATYDSPMVVTLGALLAEVAHSRPVSVIGTAYDPEVVERLQLRPSTYEGPTGIVGVLHAACRDTGLQSAALWAAVPTYVPGAPSPKAALALVERTAQLLEVAVMTTDLEIASASYERQVSELVEADDETSAYVASLEARHDDEDDLFPSGTSLVEEVERFLRERPRE